jgi:predicted nucleotidyltransferase
MKISLEEYRQNRETLITRVVSELSSDERFLAAWLTGSYARGDADHVSDLDLQVVVAEPDRDALCTRTEQVSHETRQERLALFSRFGRPALIHENNNNAPEGGTFTFVLYADSALMIDWTLMPQAKAKRPYQARLLFDKADLPVSAPPQPEKLEVRKKAVAEMWAFFWMMTAVTTKYIIRQDGVFVSEWLEHLHELIQEIERQLQGDAADIQPRFPEPTTAHA